MTAETTYEPPGPGSWRREDLHSPRPVPRLHADILPEALAAGMQASFRRYGMLLSHTELGIVDGFVYASPRIVGAPVAASKPPPKLVFQLLTRVHPEIRRRLRTAGRLFDERPWLADLARWDGDVKPASIGTHLELQAVDAGSLEPGAAAAHLDRCASNLRRMIVQHHEFTPTAIVPVADFMVHAVEWTGRPVAEVLSVMEGASAVSGGRVDGFDAAVDAVRADPRAATLLEDGDDPEATLAELRRLPGPTGAAVDGWLAHVGNRLLDGLDLGCPTALEVPAVLVGSLRVEVARTPRAPDAVEERVARLRDLVPGDHRANFDTLLDDARRVYRIRDERGVYSDVWAGGVLRRAVLDAGERLVAEGRLEAAEHLLEANRGELRAVVAGNGGPGAGELAARHAARVASIGRRMPATLGPPPPPPPPLDWIPARGRRLMRAVDLFMGNFMTPPAGRADGATVTGVAASGGVYQGRARLVVDPMQLHLIEEGDVLLAPTTTEAFNTIVPLVGAIVTDAGGNVSHPAIVARECGIPAVVGCGDATSRIRDGAIVRVDGDAGEVVVVA